MAESRPMTTDELAAFENGLDFAARLAGVSRPLKVWHVQALYDVFLEDKIEDPDSIIALGLAFGGVVLELGDFEWLRVIDEWGEENSLAVRGTKLYCHPVSMIQKRLDRRERIDLKWLSEETAKRLTELSNKAGKR
jgi:hypothetical protein